MDLIYKKILTILDQNSRTPASAIAKKLKISRQVVQYRINQLVENKIILHFTTIIDPSKFANNIWHIYVKLQNLTLETENKIQEFLLKENRVWWIAVCQGEWDLIFSFAGDNLFDFDKFISKFTLNYNNFINQYQITSFIKSNMFSRGYFLNQQRKKQIYVNEHKKVKIDKKDLAILKILAINSRISSVELANMIKLTPRQVIYRIKELIKKEVVRGFRLHLNFEKISYDYYKVCFYTQNFTENIENSIISWCELNPNTLYYVKKISPWTFEIEFETENYKKLNDILKEMRNKFGNIIKRNEITLILKEFRGELDILKIYQI